MAATLVEYHPTSRGYLAKVRFTAQADTILLTFPTPVRQLAAQANIIAGGTLTAFTATGLISLNAATYAVPVEAGFVVSEADLYFLKTDESPFCTMSITTTSWTGASTLEVTVAGMY